MRTWEELMRKNGGEELHAAAKRALRYAYGPEAMPMVETVLEHLVRDCGESPEALRGALATMRLFAHCASNGIEYGVSASEAIASVLIAGGTVMAVDHPAFQLAAKTTIGVSDHEV